MADKKKHHGYAVIRDFRYELAGEQQSGTDIACVFATQAAAQEYIEANWDDDDDDGTQYDFRVQKTEIILN